MITPEELQASTHSHIVPYMVVSEHSFITNRIGGHH